MVKVWMAEMRRRVRSTLAGAVGVLRWRVGSARKEKLQAWDSRAGGASDKGRREEAEELFTGDEEL
jgi:hypothetical protein